jgi:dTDP-4-amino-4,6-dideoxygalactose transaminase
MDRVAHYLKESFETKHLSNFGPANKLLCQKLTEFLELDSDREIILTSSGHTALMAAYNALGIRNLVVPTYTFKSTESAATLQGIPVLHAEPDLRTGCLVKIPQHVRAGDQTDGVVYVAALSTIPNFDFMPRNNPVIIDGAATFGTQGIYNLGDAFCLSFHATKTFPIGECGAVIAKKNTIEKVKQFINFGFNAERIPVRAGINAKISEYTAAIGLAVLEKMPTAIERRCQIRDIYQRELGDLIPISYFPAVYQTLPIFFSDDFMRARNCRAKLKEASIEILQYYRPLVSAAPIADMLFQTNICLPAHQDLTDEEIKYICKIIKSC